MVAQLESKYWSDELESGNALIDQQHRELLIRFEALEDAIRRGKGYNEVKGVAAFLQRYVLTHFNTEEQDMLSFNYPKFKTHAKEHDCCKTRIFKFKKFIERETDKNAVLKVALNLIGLWVRDHILDHDIEYIQYGKGKRETRKATSIDYDWSPDASAIWNDAMSLGDLTLDEQHMKLVKWTEYLLESDEVPVNEMLELFEFMHGFIYTHFTDEELYMIDHEYPELESHTEAHCAIRSQFNETSELLDQTTDADEVRMLVQPLFAQYTRHIMDVDVKIKSG